MIVLSFLFLACVSFYLTRQVIELHTANPKHDPSLLHVPIGSRHEALRAIDNLGWMPEIILLPDNKLRDLPWIRVLS